MKRIEQEIGLLKQLRTLVREMMDDNDIGTIGQRNDNGADEYLCPACYNTTRIQGHCCSSATIGSVKEHSKDCNMLKLQKLMGQLDELEDTDEGS